MKNKNTTNALEKVLLKESRKFSKNESGLKSALFDSLAKRGFFTKSEYTLPLTDTIGRRFHEKAKFSTLSLD